MKITSNVPGSRRSIIHCVGTERPRNYYLSGHYVGNGHRLEIVAYDDKTGRRYTIQLSPEETKDVMRMAIYNQDVAMRKLRDELAAEHAREE